MKISQRFVLPLSKTGHLLRRLLERNRGDQMVSVSMAQAGNKNLPQFMRSNSQSQAEAKTALLLYDIYGGPLPKPRRNCDVLLYAGISEVL